MPLIPYPIYAQILLGRLYKVHRLVIKKYPMICQNTPVAREMRNAVTIAVSSPQKMNRLLLNARIITRTCAIITAITRNQKKAIKPKFPGAIKLIIVGILHTAPFTT